MISSPELSCRGLSSSFPLSAPTERKGVSSPHLLSEHGVRLSLPCVPPESGPLPGGAAVLSGPQSLLVPLTSVSIVGALLRALQIWAPQHRFRLHPRAQGCPVFREPWGGGGGGGRERNTQWERSPTLFYSHPPSTHSSLCKLQFLTKPFFWAFIFTVPTHTTPQPDSWSRSEDNTKQVDECERVIKSSSVMTL